MNLAEFIAQLFARMQYNGHVKQSMQPYAAAPSVRYRQAIADDYPGADAVQQSVVPGDHRYRYAENLLSIKATNLVAVVDQKIVGFISLLIRELEPDGAELWQRLRPYVAFVGVLPERQSQGIGSELIRVGAQAIVSHMRPHLWLECAPIRERFFSARGFVRVAPESIEQTYGLTPKGPVYCLNDLATLR